MELDNIRWNIVGISEMRWTGAGEYTTEEGHKVWYCGQEKKKQHGVGFIVDKRTAKSILECTPVSERLISIRVASKPFNMTIIQVYAPTSDYDDQIIEEFYDDLERLMKKTPKKDVLIILGDWNAQIGENANHLAAGKFGYGETSERGMKLLDFAESHQMVVANTLHRHKASRRITWHAPDGVTKKQIDYILIPKHFQSSVNKARTRTMKKPDIGSDHDLVMTTFKLKLSTKNRRRNDRVVFDLDKLKDNTTKAKFQSELTSKFAPLMLIQAEEQQPQALCDKFTTGITETAKSILGKRRKTRRPWITKEVLESCDRRRELRRKKNEGKEQLEEYREANKTVRRLLRKAKEEWAEEQANLVESSFESNNARKVFKTIKNLTERRAKQINIIEDKEGKLLTSSSDIANRWKEYCEELYNFKDDVDRTVLEEDVVTEEDHEGEILRAEVELAVRSLKTNKSPGADNVNAELIQCGGEDTVKILHMLCNLIFRSGVWPTQWTESILIPIPKKMNSRKCSDFRTISLISHASKVLLKIIQGRITPRVEEVLSEMQAGFRKDRSTTDQITNLRLLCEKTRNHQRVICHNFIDFKKAFDRVWHEALWHTMRKFNIGEQITKTIMSLYEQATTKVLTGEEFSEWFRATVGVRQGCILSPTLFNLFLERIMVEAIEELDDTGVSCGGLKVTNLRFADDIDLIGKNEEELQDLTNRLHDTSQRFGMEISKEKSKTMVTGNGEDNIQLEIVIGDGKLEQVKSFKYLGATITENGNSDQEIRNRIGAATSAMARLNSMWGLQGISLKNRMKITKAVAWATLLYGCESWTMNKKSMEKLKAFEMKSYRRMMKISWQERKTNEFVWNKVTETLGGRPESITETVKKRKLKYFGHQMRKPTAMTKTLIQGKVEGARERGRPRRQWEDDIKEWTGEGLRELSRMAMDREKWRSSVHGWAHPRPT